MIYQCSDTNVKILEALNVSNIFINQLKDGLPSKHKSQMIFSWSATFLVLSFRDLILVRTYRSISIATKTLKVLFVTFLYLCIMSKYSRIGLLNITKILSMKQYFRTRIIADQNNIIYFFLYTKNDKTKRFVICQKW